MMRSGEQNSHLKSDDLTQKTENRNPNTKNFLLPLPRSIPKTLMKSLMRIVLILGLLTLGCLFENNSALTRVVSHCSALQWGNECQSVDDGALWSAEGSGAAVAPVQSPPAVRTQQLGRTCPHGSVNTFRVSPSHHAHCQQLRGLGRHLSQSLGLLRAPHQFVAASQYYVIALRHIIR